MPTTYRERLQGEFDQITEGITAILERAAEEGRDLTDDEKLQVERDDTRRDQLETGIKHYANLESRTDRVSQLRSTLPNVQRAERSSDQPDNVDRQVERARTELERMAITPGLWAYHVHHAQVERSRASKDWLASTAELIERATTTQHQTIADNPGLIPRPIAGNLVDTLNGYRPFVESVGTQTPPAPIFDRPRVTQHVAVAKQSAEKAPTESQKMTIGKVPVTLETFAGHLNLSKQDVRWSSPNLLDIIFNDFRKIYAGVTDNQACTDFVAGCTQTVVAATFATIAEIDAWLAAANQQIMTVTGQTPDTIWLSVDRASALAKLRSTTGDNKAYDLPIFYGSGGTVEGLRAVIDPRFAAGTTIVGISDYVEVWEDLEGFLTVEEPNLLGQLVGYAGYFDTIVLDPTAFAKQAAATTAAASGAKK